MSMMQEKMYMDVDDVCAILGVSKTYVQITLKRNASSATAERLFHF